MRPQRVTPDFREKIWGATKLSPWFPDSDRKIGEVWFDAGLPLLVKFLFTSENLSVQVHPDDDSARREHGSRGKTEMWHILAAEPGAKIAAGFREAVSAEEMREACQSGAIERKLEWFEARAGDTFFIPAGTVHAIGGGLALCEIQQNSDVTYRLYDYGRGRALHLDQAARVMRLAPHAARAGESVSCEYFETRRETAGAPRTIKIDRPGFWIALDGTGHLDGAPTKAGDVWRLYPGTELEVSGDLTFLLSFAN